MQVAVSKIYESVSAYKEKIILFLKIVFTCGIIYYIINKIHINDLLVPLKHANYILIFSVLCLGAVNITLQYFKWKLVCNKTLNEQGSKRIFLSLFYGYAGGIVTPFRVGEYVGRSMALKDKTPMKVTLASVIDKSIPLVIILFSGSVTAIIFLKSFYHISLSITILLFASLTVISILVLIIIFNAKFYKKVLDIAAKVKFLGSIVSKFQSFKFLEKKLLYNLILISVLFYICIVVQYGLLISAFANDYDLISYLWAGSLLFFAKSIIPPFTLGELGIREGFSVFFITQMGLPAAIGFNASMFLFFINILIPSLIGTILLFKRT